MSISAKIVIGRNVKTIRKLLGLSQLKFSIATGISKASLINIESGNTGYNLDLLDAIARFVRYDISILSKHDFVPEAKLRENLLQLYKGTEHERILSDQPEIVHAIEYRLLKSDFLDQPREISEIKSFFKKLELDYRGTSISNALKRKPNLIEIRKHPTKKNTNVYLKRS